MNQSLTHILFVSIFMTTVLAGAHYYLWKRLVKDAALPKRLHRALTALLVVLLISQPAVFVLSRGLPREMTAPFAFVAFIWMGLLSTYFVLASSTDIFRGSKKLIRRIFARTGTHKAPSAEVTDHPHLSRRQVLSRMVAGGVVAGGTTLGAASIAQAMGFRLKEVSVTLDKLPASFDGFTIVQMSDIHVGPTIGRDFIESIVHIANEQQADLIALTGDLVDGSVENLARHTEPLRGLRAKHGVYFVTGNHEYYSGADEWIAELARLGIPTLRNDSVRLEQEGASVLLAGVTDFRAGSFDDAPDLAMALRQRRPDEEVILMAHQPRQVAEAVQHDVGLQISGHTHGGQFWPWSWVIYLIEPVVKGLAQFGRTQIYVNSGTGYWGPPMRMGTEAEITRITLRSAARA